MDSIADILRSAIPLTAHLFLFIASLISAIILTVKRRRCRGVAWTLAGVVGLILFSEIGFSMVGIFFAELFDGLSYEDSLATMDLFRTIWNFTALSLWMMFGVCLFLFRPKRLNRIAVVEEGQHGT